MAQDKPHGRDAPPGARETRRGGLRALSQSVRDITRAALGRRALAEAALLAEWPSIVGADVAAACQPRRLSFPRRESRRDSTLVLRVKPGEAPRLAHWEPILVERVNGFFGYRAVARLRLEQGALASREVPAKSAPRALSDAESRAVEARVSAVADEELRAALARLGRSLRTRAGN